MIGRDLSRPKARAEFPEIDACAATLFGLTNDEAEDAQRPATWDDIELKAVAVQVAA